MSKKNWKPIEKQATKWAEELGHKLEPFRRISHPGIRMASCETCFGCCWVAFNDGYKAGGRLLRYACGTKEAAGAL